MTSRLEIERDKIEPVSYPDLAVSLRPFIKERIDPSNKVKILVAGGTPLSKEKSGVRTGGVKIGSYSFLTEQLSQYADRISPTYEILYDGLSEDITIQTLDEMEIDVAREMNASLDINTVLMFIGSDMGEVIGRHLHGGLISELTEAGIRLFLIWANNPIPDPQTLNHCRRALEAADKKRPDGSLEFKSGAYLVSGENIIPADAAAKHTWQPYDPGMFFYNVKDQDARLREEGGRRNNVYNLCEKLLWHFHKEYKLKYISLFDLIERMDPARFEKPILTAQQLSSGKWSVSALSSRRRRETQQGQLLYHLATDPADHPRDGTSKVLTVHANLLAEVPDYEYFENAQAVLFILNHSATTSRSNAEKIASICQRRIDEDKPLAIFAVCENGESRNWNPETGIYPSGEILRQHVILVPGHIKPTLLKLWIAIHHFEMEPSVEMLDFMLKNHVGEVNKDIIYRPDVTRVKSTVF